MVIRILGGCLGYSRLKLIFFLRSPTWWWHSSRALPTGCGWMNVGSYPWQFPILENKAWTPLGKVFFSEKDACKSTSRNEWREKEQRGKFFPYKKVPQKRNLSPQFLKTRSLSDILHGHYEENWHVTKWRGTLESGVVAKTFCFL